MSKLNLLFHIATSVLYLFTIEMNPKTPDNSTWGGSWKYLTYINMWIFMVYYGLAALNDVLKAPLTRKLRNYVFFSLAIPNGLFVAIMFWGLYAIDRELVFPRHLDAIFPSWWNHSAHTVIVIVMLIEIAWTMRREQPPQKLVSAAAYLVFIAFYIVWVIIAFDRTGRWAYPVLAEFNDLQRAAFFATMALFGISLWRVGYVLHSIFKQSSANQAEVAKAKRN